MTDAERLKLVDIRRRRDRHARRLAALSQPEGVADTRVPYGIRCTACGATMAEHDAMAHCPPSHKGVPHEILADAVAVIKRWHGPAAWDIYYAHAPEMKRIRTALAQREQAIPDAGEQAMRELTRADITEAALTAGLMLHSGYGQGQSQLMPVSDVVTLQRFADLIIAATLEATP